MKVLNKKIIEEEMIEGNDLSVEASFGPNLNEHGSFDS